MLIELVQRFATAKPASYDAAANTIQAVIATATPVARRDALGPFLEILDVRGADLDALIGASVLNSHRQAGLDDVLGVVEAARIEGDAIVATIRLSTRTEIASVIADIVSGVIRNLSVGYAVTEWREGKAADGRRSKTATKIQIREVSFVPVPADPLAKTRSALTMSDITIDRPAVNKQIRDLARSGGVASAVVDDLVDRCASIEEARETILDDIVRRGNIKVSASSSHQTFDDPEFFREAVADGLLSRMVPSIKPPEQSREFLHMTCADLARTCLQRAGVNTTGVGADGLITRAMNTTSDYGSVFANVLGKSLRLAYETAPSGIKTVARQTTNADFRAKMRIGLDSLGLTLEQVPESGEFKYGGMIDFSESYALYTFGRIFALSRQALINDDLNAFGDISRRLGQAAAAFEATSLTNMVVANPMMADGYPVFCVNHQNYVASGAGAPPSVATLTTARLAMRSQTGPGGGLLDIVPSYLVVGADLETLGEQLITETHPVDIAGVNPFSKLKGLVIEPRLPAKAWYLWCGPEFDSLEYAHLASAPGPQVESKIGFTVAGLKSKVTLDWGAGWVDARGVYYNAGQ